MRASLARSLVLLTGISLAVTACGGSGPSDTSSAALPATAGGVARSSPLVAPSGASAGAAPGAGSARASGSTGGGAIQSQTIGATVEPATADIVEDGSLAVRSRNAATLRSTYAAIAGLATRAGGFVSSSTLTESKLPTASVTVRVPNDGVESLLHEIGDMGRVTHETLSGQDVTGQVINLSVEITNLTSEEAAVRQLLSKAGSVASILTVQQQLFQLQDEVQELTGQSNSLHNRVQYATVSVTLSTTAPTPAPRHHHHPPSTPSRFWHLATNNSTRLVRGVVLAVGWSAPGLVLLAVAGAVLLVLRRRRHLTGPAAVGPSSPSGDDD